jgi:hypothetical protein
MSSTSSLPVLGIDPGARWTACVLRFGEEAAAGWTLGPVAADGACDASAMNDVDDLVALTRYLRRVLDAVDETYAHAEREFGVTPRVAVEAMRVPIGWRNGRRTPIPMADWLIPQRVLAALARRIPRSGPRPRRPARPPTSGDLPGTAAPPPPTALGCQRGPPR